MTKLQTNKSRSTFRRSAFPILTIWSELEMYENSMIAANLSLISRRLVRK